MTLRRAFAFLLSFIATQVVAQAPAPAAPPPVPPDVSPLYVVTYVELRPNAKAEGAWQQPLRGRAADQPPEPLTGGRDLALARGLRREQRFRAPARVPRQARADDRRAVRREAVRGPELSEEDAMSDRRTFLKGAA